METWKKEEIELLQSDIAHRLELMGYSKEQAELRSQSRLLFEESEAQNSAAGKSADIDGIEEYLNMRIRRIRLLTGLDFISADRDHITE